MRLLPTGRRVRSADNLLLAGLVGQAVAGLPTTDRTSFVARRVAQVVWLLLPKPRNDIGRESAVLRVAPLNQPRKIRFGLRGRQHAHHDLSSRFAKDLALTAQAVQRRRYVTKPLLHLRLEFRIVHVSPPLSHLTPSLSEGRANLIPERISIHISPFWNCAPPRLR